MPKNPSMRPATKENRRGQPRCNPETDPIASMRGPFCPPDFPKGGFRFVKSAPDRLPAVSFCKRAFTARGPMWLQTMHGRDGHAPNRFDIAYTCGLAEAKLFSPGTPVSQATHEANSAPGPLPAVSFCKARFRSVNSAPGRLPAVSFCKNAFTARGPVWLQSMHGRDGHAPNRNDVAYTCGFAEAKLFSPRTRVSQATHAVSFCKGRFRFVNSTPGRLPAVSYENTTPLTQYQQLAEMLCVGISGALPGRGQAAA